MTNSTFYDGTKLLSLLDINGEKPEIYICTTNRSGGKTTYFNRYAVKRFLQYGEKFAVLYRFNYELDDCADKFFKDIKGLFFKYNNMTSVKRARGVYHELFINEKSCGYAIALNNADQIKKNSHLFSDVQRIIFDEFQSETNHYCDNEVTKFISLHTSIARGHGEQTRYVPVFMISNPVSLINPYYVEMGISSRIDNKTKFLRGDGFVMEQGYVESAANAQKASAFNKAFGKNTYVQYSSEAAYLNDNTAFIAPPEGYGKYVATLKYKGKEYAIKTYSTDGIVYCDDKPDTTFPIKITVTTDDHDINYVMLKTNSMFIATMRYYFEKGCFRFKNLACKEAVLSALSY